MLLLFVVLVAGSLFMLGCAGTLYGADQAEAGVPLFSLAVVLAVVSYFVWGVL